MYGWVALLKDHDGPDDTGYLSVRLTASVQLFSPRYPLLLSIKPLDHVIPEE